MLCFKRWFYSKRIVFGAVNLNKNIEQDKCSYFGYGIGVDSRSLFSFQNLDWSKNSYIFLSRKLFYNAYLPGSAFSVNLTAPSK